LTRIFVCGLDEMPQHVESLRPRRLVSLLPKGQQPLTPPGIERGDHLRVLLDDIDEPKSGYTTPARTHIETLVDFVRTSPPRASILIHCLAGVSRSPAAALIAMVLDAPGRETEAATRLRAAAPFADPNRLMIELADELLDRRGKLVAGLASMGPPDLSKDFGLFSVPRSLVDGRSTRIR
jgi:predicted protein tyrosine phosphatase